MSDSHHRTLSVPNWVIEVLKLSAPAIVAILMMYVKVSLLEDKVTMNIAELKEQKAASTATDKVLQSVETSVSGIQIKQTVMEKNISDSLIRIEGDIKELKGDVKSIQRNK